MRLTMRVVRAPEEASGSGHEKNKDIVDTEAGTTKVPSSVVNQHHQRSQQAYEMRKTVITWIFIILGVANIYRMLPYKSLPFFRSSSGPVPEAASSSAMAERKGPESPVTSASPPVAEQEEEAFSDSVTTEIRSVEGKTRGQPGDEAHEKSAQTLAAGYTGEDKCKDQWVRASACLSLFLIPPNTYISPFPILISDGRTNSR